MGRATERLAMVIASAMVALSCNSILGFEGGELRPSATHTQTAAGGQGGGTGGGTTSTGPGGSGGVGGEEVGGGGGGPTPCEFEPPGACGPSAKCSVIDESTGQTACVAAGPRPAWSRCELDTDCVAGTWCDHETQVCKPICDNSHACPTGGQCVNAQATGGGNIPGLSICTAHCDPRELLSCHQGFGPTNCIYDSTAGFDCMAAGNGIAFQSCDEPRDCMAGLTCIWYMFMHMCSEWCVVGGSGCPLLADCLALSPPVFYDSVELGACR